MADFCRQCSIDLFGKDFRELSGLVSSEDWELGYGALVICEGCGPVIVDIEGSCVSEDCLKNGHNS